MSKNNSRSSGTNPRNRGTNPRALGTNPKNLGTNPRALGTNPRAQNQKASATFSALSAVKAWLYAETLATIPEFPRMDNCVKATADDLQWLCETEVHAEWLVNELRRTWTRWEGTAAMIAVYRARFPRKTSEPTPAVEKYRVECHRCNDTGFIRHGEFHYELCTCPMGQYEEVQALAEILNSRRHTLRAPGNKLPPLPAVPPAPEPERCEKCSGTGYTAHGYCDCVMGLDLMRVEGVRLQ